MVAQAETARRRAQLGAPASSSRRLEVVVEPTTAEDTVSLNFLTGVPCWHHSCFSLVALPGVDALTPR